MMGSTTFNLKEMLLDMDFPGHYLRHIRFGPRVKPCDVGPYRDINATRKPMEHTYRLNAIAMSADNYTSSGDHEACRTDRA